MTLWRGRIGWIDAPFALPGTLRERALGSGRTRVWSLAQLGRGASQALSLRISERLYVAVPERLPSGAHRLYRAT